MRSGKAYCASAAAAFLLFAAGVCGVLFAGGRLAFDSWPAAPAPEGSKRVEHEDGSLARALRAETERPAAPGSAGRRGEVSAGRLHRVAPAPRGEAPPQRRGARRRSRRPGQRSPQPAPPPQQPARPHPAPPPPPPRAQPEPPPPAQPAPPPAEAGPAPSGEAPAVSGPGRQKKHAGGKRGSKPGKGKNGRGRP